MILFLGVSSEESKDEKKPAVVDWEKNNFGIRTSHSHEDGLNSVKIDRNAPQIPKRVKPLIHEPRRKGIKPTITRNKLRIRSKSKSEEDPGELDQTPKDHKTKKDRSADGFRTDNAVNRGKSLRIAPETKDIRKDATGNHRPEGLGSGRLRSRISPRIRPTTVTAVKADTMEESLKSSSKLKPKFADFKESFMETLSSSPRSLYHRNNHEVNSTTRTASTSSTFITTTPVTTSPDSFMPEHFKISDTISDSSAPISTAAITTMQVSTK